MRDSVTVYRCLWLAGCLYRMIPATVTPVIFLLNIQNRLHNSPLRVRWQCFFEGVKRPMWLSAWHQWFHSRLQYLQCISHWDTVALHWAIGIMAKSKWHQASSSDMMALEFHRNCQDFSSNFMKIISNKGVELPQIKILHMLLSVHVKKWVMRCMIMKLLWTQQVYYLRAKILSETGP